MDHNICEVWEHAGQFIREIIQHASNQGPELQHAAKAYRARMLTFGKDAVEFVIYDLEPISVNTMYFNLKRGGRCLTANGKAFKDSIESYATKSLQREKIANLVGKDLMMTGVLHSPNWKLKDGKTTKKRDLYNFFKAIDDSLFKVMQSVAPELDDSQIWKAYSEKVYAPQTKIVVRYTPLNKENK